MLDASANVTNPDGSVGNATRIISATMGNGNHTEILNNELAYVELDPAATNSHTNLDDYARTQALEIAINTSGAGTYFSYSGTDFYLSTNPADPINSATLDYHTMTGQSLAVDSDMQNVVLNDKQDNTLVSVNQLIAAMATVQSQSPGAVVNEQGRPYIALSTLLLAVHS